MDSHVPIKQFFDAYIHTTVISLFRIRNLNRFGIIEKLQHEVVSNATHCLHPERNERGRNILRPLEMRDFYGIFAVYASGMNYCLYVHLFDYN